jgi:hypothetical protein
VNGQIIFGSGTMLHKGVSERLRGVVMRKITLVAAAAAALAGSAMVAAPASARTFVGIGIGAPVYPAYPAYYGGYYPAYYGGYYAPPVVYGGYYGRGYYGRPRYWHGGPRGYYHGGWGGRHWR